MVLKFYAALLLLICSSQLSAQRYNGGESALGVRLGGAAGVTYKKFTSRNFAFEGILSQNFDPNIKSFSATVLFEKHQTLSGKRFSALIGLGPSYIFAGSRFGAAGILGFDWRVGKSPINMQVDWLPGYFFVNDNRLNATNIAFSIRYILNHRKLYGNRQERESSPPPAPQQQ